MTLKLHATFLVLALTALGVRPAAAQNPKRPFRGLFGGAQPANMRGQMIDLSMSAFVGWDEPQTFVDPLASSSDERTQVSGPYSGGSATVTYTHPGEHFSFNADGSAFSGYFPDNNEDPWYDSYSAAAGLNWHGDLSRRTHANFSESVNASTDFSAGAILGPGGGLSNSGSFTNSLVREPSMLSQTQVQLIHDFSKKSNGSVYYGFNYSHFFQGDEFPDTGGHNVGGRYSHRLTKNLGYHMGYSYYHQVQFDQEQQSSPGNHSIDVGLDYGRALSLTRTTKFAFSLGSTIASSSRVENGHTTFTPNYFLVGDVSLTQELGQSWNFGSFYNRSVNYYPGFTQPSLNDSAGVTLNGLPARHVDVSASAVYQVGRIGLGTVNYRSWNVSAQIRTAITRNIAAYASYFYFLSDFGGDVALPPGVPRYVDRNGVRAGITAWLPLWYGRGAP